MSRYAKFDLEPWYKILNVNEEAVKSITDSARREKETPGKNIIKIILFKLI